MTPAPQRYATVTTTSAQAFDLPQRLGRALWLPMWAMAAMAFPAALALGVARGTIVAGEGDPRLAAALAQFTPAAMFLGFASVFAAIAFAIARILGELRAGGGRVQEAAGRAVRTLRRPATAYVFIALMAMAMMTLLGAVAAHAAVGLGLLASAGDAAALASADAAGEALEAVRRIGVATYLVSIVFGLSTVLTVLGFQASRIRELPYEEPLGGSPRPLLPPSTDARGAA